MTLTDEFNFQNWFLPQKVSETDSAKSPCVSSDSKALNWPWTVWDGWVPPEGAPAALSASPLPPAQRSLASCRSPASRSPEVTSDVTDYPYARYIDQGRQTQWQTVTETKCVTVKDSQTDSDIASDRECEVEKERPTVRRTEQQHADEQPQAEAVLKEILKQFHLSNWTSGVYVTN